MNTLYKRIPFMFIMIKSLSAIQSIEKIELLFLYLVYQSGTEKTVNKGGKTLDRKFVKRIITSIPQDKTKQHDKITHAEHHNFGNM